MVTSKLSFTIKQFNSTKVKLLKDSTNNSNNSNGIIFADAVGAMGGAVEGALVGAAAGPGGAVVVGLAGTIMRGAQASAAEYAMSKVKSWIYD